MITAKTTLYEVDEKTLWIVNKNYNYVYSRIAVRPMCQLISRSCWGWMQKVWQEAEIPLCVWFVSKNAALSSLSILPQHCIVFKRLLNCFYTTIVGNFFLACPTSEATKNSLPSFLSFLFMSLTIKKQNFKWNKDECNSVSHPLFAFPPQKWYFLPSLIA